MRSLMGSKYTNNTFAAVTETKIRLIHVIYGEKDKEKGWKGAQKTHRSKLLVITVVILFKPHCERDMLSDEQTKAGAYAIYCHTGNINVTERLPLH